MFCPGPGRNAQGRAHRTKRRGARTMQQLDDLLAGVDVVLSDELLDRIDEIVAPGTDIGTLDQAYVPPAIQHSELRRRPLSERSAA